MANRFNAGTTPQLQRLAGDIATMFGVEVDFQYSAGFKLELEVNTDGKGAWIRGRPADRGNCNPFGAETSGVKARTSDKQVGGYATPIRYRTLLESTAVAGTLVAGVVDVQLANVAGDRLVCSEVTAAGTAADHYSAFRVSDTVVRLHAQTVAGALQTGSTSAVKAYNFGQSA